MGEEGKVEQKPGGKRDRRRFVVEGCAALSGAAGMMAAPGLARAAGSGGKMRLRVIYAVSGFVQKTPDWPNIGFDFRPVMERYNNALTNAFPEIEFLPVVVKGMNKAGLVLMGDLAKNISGYIVVQLNLWELSIFSIAASNKPVLFVGFPYGGSGGVLVFGARLMRMGKDNVGLVSSSNMDDLIEAVKCFKKTRRASEFGAAVAAVRRERTPGPGDLSCLKHPLASVNPEQVIQKMKESRILAVGYPGVSTRWVPPISCRMISFGRLNQAYKKADRDQAKEIADGWARKAARIENVSPETLEDSAAMYLAMRDLMQKHEANAITVNCLTGFYSGILRAYPCMGFYQMNNDGLVGACECDVKSASTMIAVNAMTGGRPGYISDPVLDASTRSIIYAHCVAPNKVFGPDGPENPYEILTHSEDRRGASVRSIMPVGYMTTTMAIGAGKKQILFHRAKTTGNDPDDRACRTKLVAEPVGEFEKLFTMWDRWMWHRVTVYGDLREQVYALADAMGYQVVEEA